MADQMPFNGVLADLKDLAFGFLYFVLTENGAAGGFSFTDRCDRMHLTDSDQLDLVRAASDTSSCVRDRRQYISVVFRKIRHSNLTLGQSIATGKAGVFYGLNFGPPVSILKVR